MLPGHVKVLVTSFEMKLQQPFSLLLELHLIGAASCPGGMITWYVGLVQRRKGQRTRDTLCLDRRELQCREAS